MTARPPTFYGSVLKAIACTPNLNPDARVYETEVLPRSRRLREAQTALGAAAPDPAQMRGALAELVAILRAKRVPEDEIRDRLRDISNLHPGGSWDEDAPRESVGVGTAIAPGAGPATAGAWDSPWRDRREGA
jgi:hypothetical protein